jgi:hypothetical protein
MGVDMVWTILRVILDDEDSRLTPERTVADSFHELS